MTVSLLSSLSWKKKNPTILIKQSKSTSRGEQQQSPILKTKFFTKFFASQKSESKLKNRLEIRLYTGFAKTVVHLNVEELLYSMETKVKVKVVIVYSNTENDRHSKIQC